MRTTSHTASGAPDDAAMETQSLVEIPVVYRVPVDSGGFQMRSAMFAVERVRAHGEELIYLGDGESQMIEVSVESMRRIVATVGQALAGAASGKS